MNTIDTRALECLRSAGWDVPKATVAYIASTPLKDFDPILQPTVESALFNIISTRMHVLTVQHGGASTGEQRGSGKQAARG